MTSKRDDAIRLGRRIDWILTVTIMITALMFIYMLQGLPQRATFFPWFITISITSIGMLYIIGKLRNPAKWDALYHRPAEKGGAASDTGPAFIVAHQRGILVSIGVFTVLIIATMMIGPEFAVPLFVTVALWLNKENKIVAVLSGIAFWLIIHFAFGDFMSINLPTGYLSDALGLS